MINIKEHINYYKIEIQNPDGYPEWIQDLDSRCIPINSDHQIMDIVKDIEAAGLSVTFINFEKSNRRKYD